ncbi:MAG: SulP family inorganic anion transporter [Flavobacteriales bacterium]|nr:SulP family inorganic anion transporter [Flavobacteriales bacterium]MCB9448128.1 SulP family inorganic anion transporter [Flavobacteriales bacterium]
MFQKTFRQDFPASIVVFLVALPLCLGIALASGAPLFSGLISGIVGGIVVGMLSKSSLSVSGPAAGLVVIVLTAIENLGGYEAFLAAVVLAGAMQLILGFLKAGIVGMFFPSSVIKGMLAAIGLILILKQVPHLVGFDTDAFGEMEFFQSDGSNTFSFLAVALDHFHPGSFLVGAVSLLLVILWETPAIRSNRTLKMIPGGVLAVVVGILLNQFFGQMFPALAIGTEHLVSIPVFSGMSSASSALVWPDWDILTNPQVYLTAVTLTIVASLETLLSIEAVDKLDPAGRRTPQNAELKAQGVGNMVSGLLGGLPITAVIVRSSANVGAGAKSKMSAIFHGILLLVAVVVFPSVMNLIPLASLAAILVFVGYKLTKPSLYKGQYSMGRQQFIPFLATVVSILFTDLLIGILVGMAIGVFYILRANYQSPYHYDDEHCEINGRQITIRLSEHVSFLNKASLQLTLEQLPENSQVVLDGSRSREIDHDALEVIHNFRNLASEKNIKLSLVNIPDGKTSKKSFTIVKSKLYGQTI